VAIFWAYAYYKGLWWFQQGSKERAESILAKFNARDKASDGWYHRFGRWIVVLFLIHFISYPLVTNLFELTPFQFGLFVLGYYLPVGWILTIFIFVIIWRIHKQPLPSSDDEVDASNDHEF
jgi:hypothetical protein